MCLAYTEYEDIIVSSYINAVFISAPSEFLISIKVLSITLSGGAVNCSKQLLQRTL